MTTRRVLLAAFLFGALLSFQQSSYAQTNDYVVVPGERIGHIRLRMNAAELRNAAGAPTRIEPGSGADAIYQFNDIEVVMWNGRVGSISVRSGPYRTERGVGIGSSELDARAELGEPRRVVGRRFVYRNGISISRDASGYVNYMEVWVRGCCGG